MRASDVADEDRGLAAPILMADGESPRGRLELSRLDALVGTPLDLREDAAVVDADTGPLAGAFTEGREGRGPVRVLPSASAGGRLLPGDDDLAHVSFLSC